jgi:rhamnosyltransferase
MVQKKIAVLLAAYNGQLWLQKQIDSIFSQQDVKITLFVSVDISSDGTEQWFDQLAQKERRVHVLPHGSHFGGAARNFFRLIHDVDFSSYSHISFADQDDIWYPDKLKRAIDIIWSKQVDAYSSNIIAFWKSGKKKLINKAQPQRQYDYLFESGGPGCTYVITQKLMIEIQKCVTTNWQEVQSVGLHDWFCYAYARAHGFQWYIDPKPGLLYRQHGVNQLGANTGFEAFFLRIKKIINGWGIKQSALIVKLIGLNKKSCEIVQAPFSRTSFLSLAFYAQQCRRKRLDQFLFFFACLLLAILGIPSKDNVDQINKQRQYNATGKPL